MSVTDALQLARYTFRIKGLGPCSVKMYIDFWGLFQGKSVSYEAGNMVYRRSSIGLLHFLHSGLKYLNK